MKTSKKVWIGILTVLCIAGAGIPLLVNWLIGPPLWWGLVSALSVIFGYLLVMALIAPPKFRGLAFLLMLTGLIYPYLTTLFSLVNVSVSMQFLAPLLILVLGCMWLSYLALLLPINGWFKGAILSFINILVLAIGVNYVTELFFPSSFFIMELIVNACIGVGCTALLALKGLHSNAQAKKLQTI